MIYDCIRCGKPFKTKNIFNNHLKKKGGCIAKYISIPKNKYIDKQDKINQLFEDNYLKLKDSENSLQYGCEYCGNLYTNNSYYYKHKKKCSTDITTDEVLELVSNEDSNIQQMAIQDESQSKNLMENSQNQNSLNTTNSHNTVHTYNTQNNPNININNTITIKNYNDQNEEEILNSIPNHIKQKILQKPKTAITDLYKLIHIDTPEYRNIYIGSLKDGHGKVLKDGDWTPIQMKQLLEDAVVQSSDRLYDIANDETVNVKKSYLNQITKLLENIAENGNITNNYKKEIKVITYQFRKIIKSNYNISNNKKCRLQLKRLNDVYTI